MSNCSQWRLLCSCSRCMTPISEVLQTLRMNQFLEKVTLNEFADIDKFSKEMTSTIKNIPRNQTNNTQWNYLSTVIPSTHRSESFETF